MMDGADPFTGPIWHYSNAVLCFVVFVRCRVIYAGKLDFVRQNSNSIPAQVTNQ